MSNTKPIRFNSSANRVFVTTLRTRVNKYFKENNINQKGNSFMYTKIAVYLIGLTASFVLLYLANSVALSLLAWTLIGFFSAFSALNICHDAIHGALSNNPTVNKVFSYLFNVLGANDYVWKYAHNVVHHSFTNIQDHDEDVDAIPFVRTSPHQDHKFYHKFQQWYALPLYGLATISWVFIKDYVKFGKGKIGQTKMPRLTNEIIKLFVFKAVYYAIYLVLPFYFLDFSWPVLIAGFLIMHFVEGFTIGIIFMMAHLVDGVDFPQPDESGHIENDWAVHQLHTTANFATRSKLVSYLTGGLNFQVEHHLFPNMCHVHYPAISKIVEETAKEYNLPYHNNLSFGSALASHVHFLKDMGSGKLA